MATPQISSNFWMAGTVRDTHFATLTDGKGVLKRKLEVGEGLLDGTGQGGKLRKVVEKPDKHVRCPITGNPLEFKELTDRLENQEHSVIYLKFISGSTFFELIFLASNWYQLDGNLLGIFLQIQRKEGRFLPIGSQELA